MEVKGEVFWINTSSLNGNSPPKFTLYQVEHDGIVQKMTGDFPALWHQQNGEFVGPELYDDDYAYKVLNADYSHRLLWLVRY
jgi:hypothetical protein